MTQTYTASAASVLLAAMIVLGTWLPTVSTPSASLAATPTHVILA